MGSFYVADAVTGRNLDEGQKVVGFLVNSQRHEYPLNQDPNGCALRPAHYFALESFPIWGVAGDRGSMEVEDENQLSVRLALHMTGCRSWEELAENLFEERRGVQFFGLPDVEGGASNRRFYGLCLMHPDTYHLLAGRARSALTMQGMVDGQEEDFRDPAARGADVERVRRLLDCCLKMRNENILSAVGTAKYPGIEKITLLGDLARVCSLNADEMYITNYMLKDGPLPPLASGLSTANGKLFGKDLMAVLRSSGLIGDAFIRNEDIASVAEVPRMQEFLEQLWDCLHLAGRMYDVGAHFKPSVSGGQNRNFGSVMELSRVTAASVWAELIAHSAETGDLDCRTLDAELANMEAMVKGMRLALERARRDE